MILIFKVLIVRVKFFIIFMKKAGLTVFWKIIIYKLKGI